MMTSFVGVDDAAAAVVGSSPTLSRWPRAPSCDLQVSASWGVMVLVHGKWVLAGVSLAVGALAVAWRAGEASGLVEAFLVAEENPLLWAVSVGTELAGSCLVRAEPHDKTVSAPLHFAVAGRCGGSLGYGGCCCVGGCGLAWVCCVWR
jgi:hypothetical protein